MDEPSVRGKGKRNRQTEEEDVSTKRDRLKGSRKPKDAEDEEEELQFEDPYIEQEHEDDVRLKERIEAKQKAKASKKKAVTDESEASTAMESKDSGAAGKNAEKNRKKKLRAKMKKEQEAAKATAGAVKKVEFKEKQLTKKEKKELAAKEKKDGKEKKKAFIPGLDQLAEDEVLEYDPTAYELMHQMNVRWPCLSFDILRDTLGMQRRKFPHTLYMAAGTQAAQGKHNHIHVMKMSNLHKTKHEDDPEDDDPDTYDEDPILEERSFLHTGGVNRLRACPSDPRYIATQADIGHGKGKVYIFDAQKVLQSLDEAGVKVPPCKPIHTFTPKAEGFALDWSSQRARDLASGDGSGEINVWTLQEGKGWQVNALPKWHKKGVEDLQWGPNAENANMLLSCSQDRTVALWDTRAPSKQPALWVPAHNTDVNVVSWNPLQPHLLLSGADDGVFKVWNLKMFKASTPFASYKYHRDQITSIEWSPHDESMLAVAGADNQVSIWDISVEPDREAQQTAEEMKDLPHQLMFQHMGQHNLKEVHWHPQIPGLLVSTAEDGFNIFKPENLDNAQLDALSAQMGDMDVGPEEKEEVEEEEEDEEDEIIVMPGAEPMPEGAEIDEGDGEGDEDEDEEEEDAEDA